MKKLFYINLDENNNIEYVVINNEFKLEKCNYSQMIEYIQTKIVKNAKLENGVVKVVDNNHTTIKKLKPSENNTDNFFYIIEDYDSPITGQKINILISNRGIVYEMSEEAIILKFKNNNAIINANIIKRNNEYVLKKNKQIAHVTPLQQPIHHSIN